MTDLDKNYSQADYDESAQLEERVVYINRCSKVVKGGRNFSFSAIVVVGDRNGHVGVGMGKAREVSEAIRKGSQLARRNMMEIPLVSGTIPHEVMAKFRGANVFMRPAAPGTGVIAGGGMRAVLELGGVQNVLAKSLGSDNITNVIRATQKALTMLESAEVVCAKRNLAKI